LTPKSSSSARFQALDLLATLVAVVAADGSVLFANSALEDALGISRRSIEGSGLPACFTEPQLLAGALQGASSNQFAALRYDAWLLRPAGGDPWRVHVVVAPRQSSPPSSPSKCCRSKRRPGRTGRKGSSTRPRPTRS
jgi:two-component system nitrogen regulation sensor histidine kinase GlnL